MPGHDHPMPRLVVSACVALALWAGAAAQEMPFLNMKVSVLNPDGRQTPVARHALLVSEIPTSAPPQRVVTAPDGTARIRLRPGKYIVESDRPFVFDARTYEWARTVDVVMGRDATIELTTANATVGAATTDVLRDSTASVDRPVEKSTSILTTWQASAFELWTAHAHAAGFLADERGLVATSRRAIGDATSVEVQISQSVKVTGAVVVADALRDVAIVRVHPSAIEGVRAAPVACDAPESAAADPDRYVVDVPLFGPKDADPSLVVSAGGAGGPVFAGDGRVIGLSSPTESGDTRGLVGVRVVSAGNICAALEAARVKLTAAPPDATRLPVERARTAADDVLGGGRAFSLGSYQLSTSDFDLTLLTPVVFAGVRGRLDFTGARDRELNGLRVAADFENWSGYVAEAPPLLYVRVTPRLVEGFWMKVARGAASTQGAAIPPIKRLRPGFSRMRVLCGGKDVTPVHPFRIQARISETDAVEEGFYAFDPSAIGPACGTVSIVLSSVKDPDKTETRTVDPAIVRRIWEDLAGARSAEAK